MDVLPPPKFKAKGANLVTEWRDFKEEFELWIAAVGKEDAPQPQLVALLLLSMGKEYRTVFNTSLELSEDEQKVYETVVTKFDQYFEPQKIRKGYITEFLHRKQGQNESVQQYITALRDLGAKCNFAGDNGLKDQLCVFISNGVKDIRLREKLWSTDMSLDNIIKKCQLWEQKEQTRSLYTSTQERERDTVEVNAVQRGRSQGRGHYRARGFGGGSSHNSQGASHNSRGASQHSRGTFGRGRGYSSRDGSSHQPSDRW
jgi:hypothetical protein